MMLRDIFKSGDQRVWFFLCSQTTVNEELRFPAAACSVSPEELKELSLSLSTSFSFFLLTVSPVLAIKLLCQLEDSLDFVLVQWKRFKSLNQSADDIFCCDS